MALALTVAAASPAAGQGTTPSRTVWDSVYTAAQAQRGQGLYLDTCSACHGPMLGGIDAAPALVGGSFKSKWNGVNLADMTERIRISMPLSNPGTLSRQQVADVLAYLLSANQFPAGGTELPRQSGFLQQILFQGFRPD